MRIEYGNAQLECSASDERAKLLASEVIGLEEKVLYTYGILSTYFFRYGKIGGSGRLGNRSKCVIA